jgi:hypothetical protein
MGGTKRGAGPSKNRELYMTFETMNQMPTRIALPSVRSLAGVGMGVAVVEV